MYRAEDGKMFDDEDKCKEYEVGFVVRKYENDIKFWDDKKQPIPLLDILAKGKEDRFYYYQIQKSAENYYPKLIEDLCQYVDLALLYEHEGNIGDIIFYDETIGRCGEWISLNKRAEETIAILDELRGY